MANQALQWRLHIGVHKTATTHLQDTLLSCRNQLDMFGVHFLPRERLLMAGLIKFVRFGQFVRHGFAERALLRTDLACLRERLLRRVQTHDAVLISEERLMGRTTDLLEGFYPNLEAYLSELARIIGNDRIVIFLSIRNQADILPSAYSQALRTHTRPQPIEVLADEWLRAPPRWTDLIKRLRTVLPGASLKVWTFDDYVSNPNGVISALTGIEHLAIPEVARPERTARLSANAVTALEELQPLMLVDEEKRAATALAAQLSGPVFDPLTPREKARLSEIYEQDLAEIPASDRLLQDHGSQTAQRKVRPE